MVVLYAESDIRAVVKRAVAGQEGLRGLEVADVQRVVLALPRQSLLRGGKGGLQKGIAVCGHHDFPGLEVEGNDTYMLLWYRKTVNHRIAPVLLLHGFQHSGDDGLTGCVVRQELLLWQLALPDDGGTPLSQLLFVGLRVVVVDGSLSHRCEQTVAVANHPYLPVQSAEDDGRCRESLLRVLCQSWQHLLAILPGHQPRHPVAKLPAAQVALGVTHIAAHQLHAVAPVAAKHAEPSLRLRRRTVNDGNVVLRDHNAVLAFPLSSLAYAALLNNLHASFAEALAVPFQRRLRLLAALAPLVHGDVLANFGQRVGGVVILHVEARCCTECHLLRGVAVAHE